jgi:hypothetical protein
MQPIFKYHCLLLRNAIQMGSLKKYHYDYTTAEPTKVAWFFTDLQLSFLNTWNTNVLFF